MVHGTDVLFLPITEEKTQFILTAHSDIEVTLSELSIAEIAAILTIQHLGSTPKLKIASNSLLEKQLSKIIEIGVDLRIKGESSSFSKAMATRFKTQAFEVGLSRLSDFNIRLLDVETAISGRYLLTNGLWDFNFSDRHGKSLTPYTELFNSSHGNQFLLTSQQSRLYQSFKNGLDEHLHVQALAGTGKTHLIGKMIETLQNYRPLLLAFTKHQRTALLSRTGHANTKCLTFGELATWLLEMQDKGLGSRANRSHSNYQVSHEDVASRLDIRPTGSLNSAQVVAICRSMVSSFCNSRDATITEKHIPVQKRALSTIDEALLIQYAMLLWNQTAQPTDSSLQLPIRGYHLIKRIALDKDIVIPPYYTHVVIDEAHDIPAPLSQFLDRCNQAVITLGDSCQNVDGKIAQRGQHVRHCEIYHSVRAGRQTESIINTLIDNNPIVRVSRLEGSKDKDTKIIFYDSPLVPTTPTTILVNSEWGLFEWFQRLGKGNAAFSFLPGAESTFKKFAVDCINLYHKKIRASHGALISYHEWDDLKYKMFDDPCFKLIDRMLAKGYSLEDFYNSFAKINRTGTASIHLGRAFDAKNMEIESVMLAPDLLIKSQATDRITTAQAFASLYIGGTRAKSQLIVPGYLKDWANDISSKH
ncbi:helicase [Pseudomonas alliivorans]|nr:helicase [Pseudomonas alliivorans]